MKKYLIISMVILFLLPSQTNAAEFLAGDDVGIRLNEIIEENLYVGGGTANINGKINKDAYVAGGNVNFDGEIAKDAVFVGGTINILGTVNEDLRVAGGNIFINGPIKGEALVLGGSITFSSSASITDDSTIAGGQIVLDGFNGGNVNIYGGQVTIKGRVNGALNIQADNINIDSTAVIVGLLSYKSPKEASVQTGAQLQGGTVYTKTDQKNVPQADVAKFIGFAWFIRMLMVLAFGVVLYAIFPKTTSRAVQYAGTNFGASLLTGFIALIVIPIAAFILMITIVGFPIGAAIGMLYVLLILVAKIIAGIFIGSLIWKLSAKSLEYSVDWLIVITGLLIFGVLLLIPILGWLVRFVLLMVGMGSIILLARDKRKEFKTLNLK